MTAKKKSEYAWMRYFAFKVFIKQMKGEKLYQLFRDAKEGKGQDFLYDMAKLQAGKTQKTCPPYERFRADYLMEKGLEGVFIRFPNNRPQGGDMDLAVIRIRERNEAVFMKHSTIQFFGPVIHWKEELEGPVDGKENPFRLKAAEAEGLLDKYISRNIDFLLETGEQH